MSLVMELGLAERGQGSPQRETIKGTLFSPHLPIMHGNQNPSAQKSPFVFFAFISYILTYPSKYLLL